MHLETVKVFDTAQEVIDIAHKQYTIQETIYVDNIAYKIKMRHMYKAYGTKWKVRQSTMVIGILKEVKENEFRVSATPATVNEMVRHGHTVYVETGAGVGSGFPDEAYQTVGAVVADTETVWKKADLYYKVKELFPQEYKWMNKDKILFTYIHSNAHPEETDVLLSSHVAAVAYEDVEDKNGRFPLLRPMSELAGKGGFLAALYYSQSVHGGNGMLLANVAASPRRWRASVAKRC